MKKKLIISTALLSTMVLGGLALSFTNSPNKSALVDLTNDYMQQGAATIDVRSLATSEGIEYSKTYAQYAKNDEGTYYLRFATAIKGSDVDSITYTRAEVVGKDSTVYEAKEIEITQLYTYLVANGEKTYFNGSDLVNEESEETKNYYWACFSIEFGSDNCFDSNINVSLSINEEVTENTREVTLNNVIEEAHNFEEIPSSFDENYHYYSCTDEGVSLVKKEAHTPKELTLVEPTLTSAGLTEGVGCEYCQYSTQKELPQLNESDYTLTSTTGLVDEVVYKTYTYTLKDETIGNYSFDVVEELSHYILAGTTYYSIEDWNEAYPNQVASVDEESNTLTIALKEGTVTEVADLDGVLNLSSFAQVIITGNGSFNVKVSGVHDALHAYSLTIDEGAEVNLTGAEEESAIKVFKNFNINGTLNISNFAYGQALAKDKSDKITTVVGENGVYNITNVKHGIHAWSSVVDNPMFEFYGKLNIEATSHAYYLAKASDTFFKDNCVATISSQEGYGIYSPTGSVVLRDNADVTVNGGYCEKDDAGKVATGHPAIYQFRNLIVGNGDYENTTQNNASLKVLSRYNCIQTSTTYARVVFNTTGEVRIESSLYQECTGIQFSNNTAVGLTIKTSNMSIVGALNAIGAWTKINTSFVCDYNYQEPNAKLKLVDCSNIFNSGYNNGTIFAPYFTNDTVQRITSAS